MEALGINVGYLLVQIIAFIVIYTLMTRFIYTPLMNTLRARRERIAKGLEDAAAAANARLNAEAEAEKVLAQARQEVARNIEEGRNRGADVAKQIEADARTQAEKILADARASAAQARDAELAAIRGQVAAIAIAATQRLIGATLALLLFDQPFGFVALLGLIGLAGILMRNTLILTQQVSDNLRAGMAPETAIVEAAVRRARPVVLTALAAALAFVPLTFDGFWGPLAYVLIGGVLAGTVVTLLFVPALYAIWFGFSRSLQRRHG